MSKHLIPLGHVRCPVCEGSGKDYRNEDRDPIEGWKMATRYDCVFCSGVGSFDVKTPRGMAVESYWNVLHHETMIRQKMADAAEQRRKAVAAGALTKLTPEEREALGLK